MDFVSRSGRCVPNNDPRDWLESGSVTNPPWLGQRGWPSTRGHQGRAPIGKKYSLGDKFGVYAVFFKEDEFRAPTREEHEFFLQKRLAAEAKAAARRAERKAGELDDSDDSDDSDASDSESEDDDC